MHTVDLPPGAREQAAAPSLLEIGTTTLPGPHCSPAERMLVLPSACAGEAGMLPCCFQDGICVFSPLSPLCSISQGAPACRPTCRPWMSG